MLLVVCNMQNNCWYADIWLYVTGKIIGGRFAARNEVKDKSVFLSSKQPQLGML